MALTKEQKAEIVAKYGENEKDTGSTKVQIAILTKRISNLTEHLKVHKQDAHTRRGLSILIGKRRGLLDYLAANDYDSYKALISDLGIRK
mgnify:CR=1 FL=1